MANRVDTESWEKINILHNTKSEIVGVLTWENLHFRVQSWNYLHVIRNTFRPQAQKIDTHKLAYLISYSLNWLFHYLENRLSSEAV